MVKWSRDVTAWLGTEYKLESRAEGRGALAPFWPHPSSQDPLQQRTAWAISQLATRRYQPGCRRARAEWPDSGSSCSSAPVCAICLEEFSEGQVRQGRGSPP